jgi:hypothetical protein
VRTTADAVDTPTPRVRHGRDNETAKRWCRRYIGVGQLQAPPTTPSCDRCSVEVWLQWRGRCFVKRRRPALRSRKEELGAIDDELLEQIPQWQTLEALQRARARVVPLQRELCGETVQPEETSTILAAIQGWRMRRSLSRLSNHLSPPGCFERSLRDHGLLVIPILGCAKGLNRASCLRHPRTRNELKRISRSRPRIARCRGKPSSTAQLRLCLQPPPRPAPGQRSL